MSWKRQAACRGRTDLDWFAFTQHTVEVCRGCPVRMDCLSEGLGDEETPGTWGMTSEAQRRRIRTGKATVEQVWQENSQGVLL